MPELKQGTVSVAIPDHIILPAQAGDLTSKDMQRLEKARRGVGLTCDATATAMEKDPQRLAVQGVEATKLRAAGKVAEDSYRLGDHRPGSHSCPTQAS